MVTWSSARSSVSGVFAALALLFLLASCGTINGQSMGDIFGSAKDSAGGAVDGVGNRVGKAQDDTLKNLDKKFGPDIIDPDGGLTRQDYRDRLTSPTPALRTDKYNEPAIPNVSQLLIDPKAPTVGKDKLITLNVTEDVPLKEVLVELARRADIDIELDPNIRGGIIFRAKDRPFSEVIDRICELTGLRYSVENGVLKVERDFPYVENYQVDFLNITRSNKGGMNISTQVLSGGGGATSGGGNLTSGSQSQLQSQYEGDLWKAVEENINNILKLYGTTSPGIAENPSTNGGVLDDGLGELLGETPRPAAGVPTAPAGAASGVNRTPTAMPLAKPGSPTVATPLVNAAAKTPKVKSEGAGASDIIPSGAALLSINKQAGVISVLANQRQHREIIKYLNQIKRQQSAQVLIEAKVVEVTLDDAHKSGIDWGLAVKKLSNFSISSNFAQTANPVGGAQNFFTATLPNNNGLNLDGFIQFAQTFGVTRTLSSPRINAINNQQAILTFAQNQVYFEVQIQQNNTISSTTTGISNNQVNISSTPRTVPLGVILSLQPSINLDTNEITMNVRPTLTRQKGTVSDPAVALQVAQLKNTSDGGTVPDISSTVPIIEVRELDSILKIKSGQVMVIGGLMEERVENTDTGVPYLSNIPFTGNLFKKTDKETSVVETVIFIKATIVPGFGVDASDKKLYRKFTNDPHPLTF